MTIRSKAFFLLWTAAAFTPLAAEAATATLFVAPGGADSNPGTQDRPLATLAAARDAARKAGNGSHRIILAAGDYFLPAPLELDARDNGLSIEAGPGGPVTLYGGKLVTAWRRDGQHLWSADLPGVKDGTWDFRALVVNGRMADRARFPESGAFLNRGTWNLPLLPAVGGFWERKPTQEELTTMPYDPQDIPAGLDVRNAEVRMYHMWDESLVGVARNDLQRHALIFSSPAIWPAGALGLKKYVIFNTREGMTQPGQWYLDRTSGRVVYWPLPGEDMARAKIIAPALERIIHIAGTSRSMVQNITLRGLALQATTTPLRPGSFGAGAFDGAVTLANCCQCVLERLEICDVGGLGIRGQEMARCRVVGCHVHHVGACGVRIDGAESLVRANHIHHVGIYYPSAAASMFGGRGHNICRNEIHDGPYSGIIGGGKDHLFEENLIYRVMREMHDGAAIYGNLAHCVLRRNMVRDIVEFGKGFGVSAYYLDEGADDCIVEQNVSVGVGRPTHNHIARNITIRDNVFIAEKDMQLSFQRSANCAFEHNTLVCREESPWDSPTPSRAGRTTFCSPAAWTRTSDRRPLRSTTPCRPRPLAGTQIVPGPGRARCAAADARRADFAGGMARQDPEPRPRRVPPTGLRSAGLRQVLLRRSLPVCGRHGDDVRLGPAQLRLHVGKRRRRRNLPGGQVGRRPARDLRDSRLRWRALQLYRRRRCSAGGRRTTGPRGPFRRQGHQRSDRHGQRLARRMGHPPGRARAASRRRQEDPFQHGRLLRPVRRVALLGRHAGRKLAARPGGLFAVPLRETMSHE